MFRKLIISLHFRSHLLYKLSKHKQNRTNMQFFDIKANKLYNFLHEIPLENHRNQTKAQLKNSPEHYEEQFNFYLKGNKITVL